LTDAEIALACGSHAGQPEHVSVAESMLRKAGRDASSLECGVHWPLGEAAARGLAACGGLPTALHNNCSGKHAGFICLACQRRLDPTGYVRPEHPVMREVTAALAAATAATLDDTHLGIDGCSIPTFALPLRALATGFARLGTGHHLSPSLAQASARIRTAIAANPLMLAGTDRFDTRIATAYGEAVLCKCGAEGTAAAAIPELGIGLAIKIHDGAGRAVEVAMASLLLRSLADSHVDREELGQLVNSPLRNWNGLTVGRLRAC
jgi:L-asparaginase II